MAPTVGSTLQTLVERIANREHVMEQMTTASTNGGTTTTAVAGAAWRPNGYYEGLWLYVSATNGSAAPYGEERQIKQSTQATSTLSLSYAMTAAIPNSATIQLYARWSRAQIVHAINGAIRAAAGYWYQRVKDESTTTPSTTYTISLAALTVPVEERYGILRVSYQGDENDATYPWKRITDWELLWSGTTPTLQFVSQYPSARSVRLEYIASPSTLSAASDKTGVVESYFDTFIEEYALFLLYQPRGSLAPTADKRTDSNLANQHRDEAERIRRMHSMRQPNTRIRGKATQLADDGKYLGWGDF